MTHERGQCLPDDPGAYADPVLARTAARLSKLLEVALAEAPEPLSLPQYRALAFLGDGPERTRRLADLLAVSPPTITALVDGLVAKGYVDRVATEGDRRGVRHELTEAGAAALAAAEHAIARRLAHLAANLDDLEARRAIDGLTAWGVALERGWEAARARRLQHDADAAAARGAR